MTGPLVISPGGASDPEATGFAVPERPVLDLRHVHFDRAKGALRALGTWLMVKPYRPCAAIVPSLAPLNFRSVVPCIVNLDDAWQWTEEAWEEHAKTQATKLPQFQDAGPQEACAMRVIHWIHSGYLPGSAHNNRDIFRVIDFIQQDVLPFLLTMPPTPVKHDKIAGDVTVRTSRGDVIQRDIKDNV